MFGICTETDGRKYSEDEVKTADLSNYSSECSIGLTWKLDHTDTKYGKVIQFEATRPRICEFSWKTLQKYIRMQPKKLLQK